LLYRADSRTQKESGGHLLEAPPESHMPVMYRPIRRQQQPKAPFSFCPDPLE
jgi:hypothetical protein